MQHLTVATVTGMMMVFVAGLMRGFTGFGFSLAAVPLLSLLMPPAQAVPIILLLQLCVSLLGLRDALRFCHWRSVMLLGVGATIASPIGVWGLAMLPPASVRLVIALIVVAGATVLARGGRMAVAPTGWLVLPFGFASGLFNGLAGIPGPPIIAFYLGSPVLSSVARASMIVFFLATSILGLVPLAWFGLLDRGSVVGAAFGLPAVLFGSWFGAFLYGRSADHHYRRVALIFLFVMATLSAWRAAMGVMA